MWSEYLHAGQTCWHTLQHAGIIPHWSRHTDSIGWFFLRIHRIMIMSRADLFCYSDRLIRDRSRFNICPFPIINIHTYIHTYHSRFIPEGVSAVSQIFLRDTHVLPKLVSFAEHCRRNRW
jgi:hypothetical protein